MKLRIAKRYLGMPGAIFFLASCCRMMDRSIPHLRTGLLAAGVVAAAFRMGRMADFLFVTGLVFHLAIWFESHWMGRHSS